MLRDEPGIKHAILLTDGKNEHETADVLEQVLAEAEGVFQCDCRGVGADWVVAELRTIATALLGTYDIVARPVGPESRLRLDDAPVSQQAGGRRHAPGVDSPGGRGRRC